VGKDLDNLYKGACGGDVSAENELFSNLLLRFRVIAGKRIWSQEDAEEIVQEALKAISINYKDADLHGSFAAWAYKVLLHKIWHYYATKKRESKFITPMDTLELTSNNWTPDPVLEQEILKCIKKLFKVNPRFAKILVLVYRGYKVEEVCDRFGITKNNYYTILSRARSMIKSCLDKGEFE
jgi:RNA polymerase sigma-70 factor (ECF subfamily)